MKSIKLIIIFALSIACDCAIFAQSVDENVFKAMTDEMKRSTSSLILEKYNPPFYVSYQVTDAIVLYTSASLGAIVQTQESPNKSYDINLMYGNYSLNDENFVGNNRNYNRNSLSLPMNNDYSGIRRTFWIASDQSYKASIESYEQKMTALKQQNKDEDQQLDDFTKLPPVNYVMKEIPYTISTAEWEKAAKEVSAIFKTYDQIYSSSANVYIINGSVFYTSSEGTKMKYPISFAFFAVNADTQADDGEKIADNIMYYALTPNQLPSLDKIKQEVKKMADNLVAKKKAQVIADNYTGPVIFEGEALGELCAQKLFRPGGLIASREPVYAVEQPGQGKTNKFDSKVNQKICAANISITATPRLKTFNNIDLIGNFDIDAEGVKPDDEMVLVNKGILKTLLNNRVPTPKVKESNGYYRTGIFGSKSKAPGVINITFENGQSVTELRKNTLKQAGENGLESIYVIKKLESWNPGAGGGRRDMAVAKPIGIYEVSVKTGEEKLVRSAIISDFPMNAFKQIIGGTNEQIVYNTLVSMVPASLIVPQAIVFDDLSIEKEKATKVKPPIVPNPIAVLK